MIARNARWTLALAATSCLLFSACGSQVPPNEFVGAQGGAGNGNLGGNGTSAPSAFAGSSQGAVLPNGNATGANKANNGANNGNNGNSNSGNNGNSNGGNSGNGGAVVGVKAGSCTGFKNSQGITNTTINLANVADLSGPVEQLFKSVQTATMAYAAYFNSTSSICGRKLKVQGLDSGTSESGDQQASQTACGSAFAMVGSMGAFDAGGADTVAHCGIPDIRAAATETTRQRSPVTFGAYSLNTSEIPTAPFTYFKSLGDAYKHAVFVYLDAGASSLNAKSFMAGETKMGFNFVYHQAISVKGGLIPYDSYASTMCARGIKYVQYIGSAAPYAGQLKAAIDNQKKSGCSQTPHFNPMFVMDPTGYSKDYTSSGSSEGTYVFDAGPLFEEANRNPPLAAYLQWLQRTSGGSPTFYGVYAWSAAALFTHIAVQLGGRLSRATLLAELRKIHNWTNAGMVPPNDVAGKHTPTCLSVMQYSGGRWVRKTPYPYTCAGSVNSGVS